MTAERLNILLEGYIQKTLSDIEQAELMDHLADPSNEETVKESVTRMMHDLRHSSATLGTDDGDQILSSIFYATDHEKINAPVHRVHLLKTAWFRYAAAIIIIFGIGAYLWNNSSVQKPAITQRQPVPVKNDALPGGDKAVLTLSNGRQITLDTSAGQTINEGNLAIQNANGELLYTPSNRVVFNTMTTPKGGQYKLTLADGTKVWLNAASSITFPTAFTSSTREVTITGEAYFEVAMNKSQAFVVRTPKELITVLGTSFNVNSYEDEPYPKTSLVTGAIKVNDQILKPGQAYSSGKIALTNINQDIAWKNGRFDFEGLGIRQAMSQIARWYDITVQFEGSVETLKLRGGLKRSLPLNELFMGLEGVGGLHFTMKGKTVIVSR